MSKLLNCVEAVLRGASQVESNSIDMSGYAFEDTCQFFLTIFIIFLALISWTFFSFFSLSPCLKSAGVRNAAFLNFFDFK